VYYTSITNKLNSFSAIQDWMVMTWNGVMHIFGGIDDSSLNDASFYNLRQQGAFLVSGARLAGYFVFKLCYM
jgi:hypothetical protein